MIFKKLSGTLLTIVIATTFICSCDSGNAHVSEMTDWSESQIDSGIADTFTHHITSIEDLLEGRIQGIVYFGRDTCPFCFQFNKSLAKVLENSTIDIFKFDTDKWRSNEHFDVVLEHFSVTSIPTLVRIDSKDDFETFIYTEPDNGEATIEAFEKDLYKFLTGV